MIKRLAAAAVAVTCLALAAGVAGAVTGAAKGPTGITIWVGWSKSTHEFSVFNSLIAEYNRKHPAVKVKVVGDINDDKIIAAHPRRQRARRRQLVQRRQRRAATARSGGWIDLGPYMKTRQASTRSMFPAAPRYYTQYNGIRCAMPLLADDLRPLLQQDAASRRPASRGRRRRSPS